MKTLWARFKRWHWRLRWQLMLTYVLLIIIPLALTGVIVRSVTENGLTVLITQSAQHRAEDMARRFAVYYQNTGSWSGVSDNLVTMTPLPNWLMLLLAMRAREYDQIAPPLPDGGPQGEMIKFIGNQIDHFTPAQILLVDSNGIVIATDGPNGLGQRLLPAILRQGAPITVSGQQVGTLVIGEALGVLSQQQRDLLQTIATALWVSGTLAVALAILVGLLLSWQITHPARQLMIGVQRLASGQWTTPLPVHAHNEFGDLTHAFNAMAAELTHQEALRRQMVADVAHDLRTPLSAMQLEIEALEAGLQTPEDAALSLREEVDWLQRLVEDLRLLSLMDANQIRLQPKMMSLYDFLTRVYDFWQPMVAEQGRTLCFEASPELPSVSLDPGRMQQVFGNLIDNALRHTPAGGTITIVACRRSLPDSGVQIEVRDTGNGIAPTDLPHIFDRFYRADQSRPHEFRPEATIADQPQVAISANRIGSGLGLSIAQRLVELHQGHISVSSTWGEGATFRVELPTAI